METTHYFVTAAFCLLLSATSSCAQRKHSRDLLFGGKCDGIPDEAGVSIFAWPVTRIEGEEVDLCSALDRFVKISRKAAKGRFKKNVAKSAEAAGCGNPDFEFAVVSNTVPGSNNGVCDITNKYLDLFKGARKFICLHELWPCTGNGRRLLQEGSRAQASNSVSVGPNGANLRVEASQSSQGQSTSNSVVLNSSNPVAGITVCKGECCITIGVKGEMYNRFLSLASESSCSNFDNLGQGQSVTVTSSGPGSSASATGSFTSNP